MSPTPVSMAMPTAPPGYVWEATTEQVAARYGVPSERIVRFDLNTAAEPPDVALAALAAGRFEGGLSEYPPSDYRRLTAAAARRYGVPPEELLVGAGADEVLDVIAKTFLPPGATAVVPTPSYAMFRVLTEQRGARVVAVPRLGPADGFAIDGPAVRAAGRTAAVVWLCSPNNPTGLPEPAGTIATLLDELAADAAADGRRPPDRRPRRGLRRVRRDEPRRACASGTRRSSSSGRPARRTAWPACGSGFAIGAREVIAAMEPYRPPGSVSTVSVAVVDGGPRERRHGSPRGSPRPTRSASGWPPL